MSNAKNPTSSDPVLAVAARLLALSSECDRVETFLAASLPLCLAAVRGKSAALLHAEAGQWVTLGHCGGSGPVPADLLGDALEQQAVVAAGAWLAVPLTPHDDRTEVLALELADRGDPSVRSRVTALVECLRPSLRIVRGKQHAEARARRLETILEIAADWTSTLETSGLLERMAAAATQLLDAERASIFLHDPRTRTLVGRPALGVGQDELRIPADKGVVGQVVSSGQPRRVGAADRDREIDHSVDAQLRYVTRSVLCVPLRGRNGTVLGAFELLNKHRGDFTAADEEALTELAAHAAIALENSQQHEQLLRSHNQMTNQAAARVQWIGECPAMRALRATIERIASTGLAVLVLGENGTGKEVVAQLIHYLSSRRQEPFVAVNCAALPDTLLESELFGHERGAFTDAREMRQGKFELAAGGTLLLDEIGDLSPGGQAKLLRVLEDKTVVRVGGSTPIPTDARIIAATNQPLGELVSQKRFRQDLFFRLTVVTLELPPLRDRGEDVLRLAEHFLLDYSAKARRRPPTLTAAASQRLLSHSWPGNVRELRNLIERIVYLLPHDTIDAGDISFGLTPAAQPPSLLDANQPLDAVTREFQAAYIQRQIDRAGGNMTDAAERLGLHRSNLYRKMKQLGMDWHE